MPRDEARRERLLPFRRTQAELRPVSERLAMDVISGNTSFGRLLHTDSSRSKGHCCKDLAMVN
ncbi:hypothetical protein EWM60_17305 [Candidatus Erwinia dacicola]|uniref:hypothetical protein n=1 Tax=Candidatus Erwinia dacicola TaxID=252393 RepID=UPI0011D14D88|nr:hypothetical protein [Candidatus Erwinia dacicola]NJD86175.1 hypothetical protein [Candidatus Erwinia dacicola]